MATAQAGVARSGAATEGSSGLVRELGLVLLAAGIILRFLVDTWPSCGQRLN